MQILLSQILHQVTHERRIGIGEQHRLIVAGVHLQKNRGELLTLRFRSVPTRGEFKRKNKLEKERTARKQGYRMPLSMQAERTIHA
jgi:hypothetical protein